MKTISDAYGNQFKVAVVSSEKCRFFYPDIYNAKVIRSADAFPSNLGQPIKKALADVGLFDMATQKFIVEVK